MIGLQINQRMKVLVQATPMIFCGLAVGIAGKMSAWNIDAEGQFMMGGAAAAGGTILPE